MRNKVALIRADTERNSLHSSSFTPGGIGTYYSQENASHSGARAVAGDRKFVKMQNRIPVLILALAAVLAFSSAAVAQSEKPPAGWKTCPHCLTPAEQRREATFNPQGMPYNPRSLDGIWNSRPDKVGDFE